jgi:hypothetical protein
MQLQKIRKYLPPGIIIFLRTIIGYVPELFPEQHHEGNWGARYYYSVWLRHLITAYKNGFQSIPQVIVEFGPGGSFGVGLAALLSGAERYQGLDAVSHFNIDVNLGILEEIQDLFFNRTKIPAEDEFPNLRPHLDSYEFPHHILSGDHLKSTLSINRINTIRKAIINVGQDDNLISYNAPYNIRTVKKESADLIISQAVLEHIDNLRQTYESMYFWLKKGGFISNTIDYKSHDTSSKWNGHWKYSDLMWRLIRGRKPYLINRYPHSTHVDLLEESGFQIVCDLRYKDDISGIGRDQLSARFVGLSDEDLVISGAFIQAVKK